jgi:WD40 repeat protein
MINHKKNILVFLVCAVILGGTVSVFAQQLPEIIWDKIAHNPQGNPNAAETNSIKFSPDGQRLYAGGGQIYVFSDTVGSITKFAATDGTQLGVTSPFFQIDSISDMTFVGNEQRLATSHVGVACDVNMIDCRHGYILYDSPTLARLRTPPTARIAVNTIDYSSTDQILAVGNFLDINNILILDPNELNVIRQLPGHDFGTYSVRFSPDGQFLASGGGDGTVKIWRVSDSSLVRTFNFNQSNDVYSVAFSPDGQYIAAADTDHVSSERASVRIWRVSDGALIRNFDNSYNPNNIIESRLAWTPDGGHIANAAVSGFEPSRIRFWNIDSGQMTNEYFSESVNRPISAIEFAPDGRTFAFSSGSHVLLARNPVAPNNRNKMADFDGDGRSDVSVFRNGTWYIQKSTDGFAATEFGLSSDKTMSADFDGDGKTDIAVFRDGFWYWLNSSDGNFRAYQFGQAGDIPVPADYTGDGRTEIAVYRAGYWYSLNLADNSYRAVQFGITSDKPVQADFDGDGKTDQAVYRDGVWYYLQSSDNGVKAVQFGAAADQPITGDFDGDGRADQAIFRNGVWYILKSTQGFYAETFGYASDIPVAADYDGDGKTDIAVFRNGFWYMQRSQQGFSAVSFGINGDRAIPAVQLP